MFLIFLGLWLIYIAAIPDPHYYWGESFGIKVIPYWVTNWWLVFLGGIDLGEGARQILLG